MVRAVLDGESIRVIISGARLGPVWHCPQIVNRTLQPLLCGWTFPTERFIAKTEWGMCRRRLSFVDPTSEWSYGYRTIKPREKSFMWVMQETEGDEG